jgi:peptide deformylase
LAATRPANSAGITKDTWSKFADFERILGKTPPRMVYPIIKFPDPILQRPSEPVIAFDAELSRLVDDMFESMYVAHGIGLAAPQIGIPKRLTVIDLSFQKTPEDKITLINPEVVTREGKIYEEEGCLSLPDIREKVARAAKVRIRAQDVRGDWFERDADDLLARAFQHEIDHLDGILFIFRISALKRDFAMRKIRKLQRAGDW